MSLNNHLQDTLAISKYLNDDNTRVKSAIAGVVSTVQAAASQAARKIRDNRESITETPDYLDGILVAELGLSQTEEIENISAISKELESFFDSTVCRQAFPETYTRLREREEQLAIKEAELEKIIHMRVADAEAKAKQESTTSKGLFESALVKGEKVFDQNKITRFVCSTISRFQEEFERIRSTRDVEHVTKLFQETIEPFQITRIVADKDGKLTKVITNSFTDDCYQDLFLFFFKYYNELMDIFETKNQIPSTAEELARVFTKKRKGAEQIIAQMHRKK